MDKKRHAKLKGRMREYCVTLDTISSKSQISTVSISHRMTGREPWSYDMILDICDLCNIDPSEIPLYFERSNKA